MAFVLQGKTEEKRGVICLTHKEAAYTQTGVLFHPLVSNWRHLLLPRTYLGPFRAALVRAILRRLRRNFSIGVHIGSTLPPSHPAFDDDKWDFVLSTDKLWRGRNTPKQISLVSAFFVPENIQPELSKPRVFDAIHIATDIPAKNWPKFVDVSRDYVSKFLGSRILAISTHPSDAKARRMSNFLRGELGEVYGNSISHVPVVMRSGEKGLPVDVIEALMRSSKVLLLFSRSEGTSKVVGEALMAGCIPVVYEDFILSSADWGMIPSDFLMRDGDEVSAIRKAQLAYEAGMTASHSWAERVQMECGLETNTRRLAFELTNILGFEVSLSPDRKMRFKLPGHTTEDMPWLSKPTRRRGGDLCKILDWYRIWRVVEPTPP